MGSLTTLASKIMWKMHGVVFPMRMTYIHNQPPPHHPSGHYVILDLIQHLPRMVASGLPRENPGKFYLFWGRLQENEDGMRVVGQYLLDVFRVVQEARMTDEAIH